MSTVNNPQPAPATKLNPTPVKNPNKSFTGTGKQKKEMTLLFDKENYYWMFGGLAMIFIGFMLMSGGKSANPHEFHYEEIYSFRRITLAPIIILLGFGVEAYAIMKKPKDAAE